MDAVRTRAACNPCQCGIMALHLVHLDEHREALISANKRLRGPPSSGHQWGTVGGPAVIDRSMTDRPTLSTTTTT